MLPCASGLLLEQWMSTTMSHENELCSVLPHVTFVRERTSSEQADLLDRAGIPPLQGSRSGIMRSSAWMVSGELSMGTGGTVAGRYCIQ